MTSSSIIREYGFRCNTTSALTNRQTTCMRDGSANESGQALRSRYTSGYEVRETEEEMGARGGSATTSSSDPFPVRIDKTKKQKKINPRGC